MFSRTLWCNCEIFLVLAKYKGILNKKINGDPKLLFHIFKVKYLKIIYLNFINFYQSVLLEKNFLEKISKKVGFWGNYPLIFILSDQTYDSKNHFFKIRL